MTVKYIFMSLSLNLMACSGGNTPSKDTGIDPDTDTEEPTPDYPEGCFVVDGAEGYYYLNDAIDIASEGSIITTSACLTDQPNHEEAVIINKSVTVVGTEGWMLTAPANETGVYIGVDDVEVTALEVVSTRNGVVVEGASNVSLSDLTLNAGGNYGLKIQDSEGISVSNIELNGNSDGGLYAKDSTVIVSQAEFQSNENAAVIVDGGELQLSEASLIQSIQGGLYDGVEIVVDGGASVTGTMLTIAEYANVGAQVVDGNLALFDTILTTSGGIGVLATGTGSVELTNVDIIDNLAFGMILQNSGRTALDTVNITVDESLSVGFTSTDWWDEILNNNSLLGGLGALITSDELSFTDVEVSGYLNCGLYLAGSGTLTATDMTVQDVGMLGLYIVGYETDMTNVSLINIFDNDDIAVDEDTYISRQELCDQGDAAACELANEYISYCGSVDRHGGIVAAQGDFQLTNVELEDVDGYGVSLIAGSGSVSTITASNSFCSSVIAFQSALSLDDGLFHDPNTQQGGLGASFTAYEASSVSLSNSVFNITIEGGKGIHSFLRGSTNHTLDNVEFNGGSYGVYAYDSSFEIFNNSTFNSQLNAGVVMDISTGHTFDFDSVTITGDPSVSSYGVQCLDEGSIEMTNSTISNIGGYYGNYLSGCSFELESSLISDIAGYGMYLYGGSHELSDVTFDNVGSTYSAKALYLYATAPSDIVIEETTINGGYGGFHFTTYDSTSSPLSASITETSINNSSSDGIYNYGGDISFNDESN